MYIFYFLINLLPDSLTPKQSGVTLFFIIDLDMPPSNPRMRFTKLLLHFVSPITLLIRPSPVSVFFSNEMRLPICHFSTYVHELQF